MAVKEIHQLLIIVGILWCSQNVCDVFGQVGVPADGDNICWQGQGVCMADEVCVTWERICSGDPIQDPNCRQPILKKLFTECVDQKKYTESVQAQGLKPKSKACPAKSVYILGYVRECFAPPCPPYWTYYCYKKTASTLTCDTIKVQEGYVCRMGLNCQGGPCKPVPNVVYVGDIQ